MGVWLLTADVLAASRFVTSPLAETVNALGVLASRTPQPWERDWLARHRQAFRRPDQDGPVQHRTGPGHAVRPVAAGRPRRAPASR